MIPSIWRVRIVKIKLWQECGKPEQQAKNVAAYAKPHQTDSEIDYSFDVPTKGIYFPLTLKNKFIFLTILEGRSLRSTCQRKGILNHQSGVA